MIVKKLDSIEFDFILNQLSNATLKNKIEIEEMNLIHGNVINTKNRVMNIGKSKHYSNSNITLYNKLQELFGRENCILDCFYKFNYGVGDYAKPHHDSYSNQTSILLLSDDFSGGDFILNKNNLEFKQKGTFITFNSKDEHSVSKITKGIREVLVMLFKSNNKITLI